MAKNLIIFILILFFGVFGLIESSRAEVLFADRFDMASDIQLVHQGSDAITSEFVGNWDGLWANQGTTAYILSEAGHSGRGIRFTWVNNLEATSAMEGCLFVYPASFTQTYPDSLWIGYWQKSSMAQGGPEGNDHLKLLRLYAGGNSVIPDWFLNSGELVIGANGCLENASCFYTGYHLADADWHNYVWQFRGASTASGADGIIRLYVDGASQPVFESANAYYAGTDNREISFMTFMGNMSAGWTGGNISIDSDDFIIANTKSEIDDFLGSSSSDTTPPGSPTGLLVS